MKSIPKIVLILLVSLVFVSPGTFGKQKSFKFKLEGAPNVLNYYFATLYAFNMTEDEMEDRRATIMRSLKVKDIKNGYIKIAEPVQEGWTEAALFRDIKNKKDYLFVNDVGCGPGCASEVTIYYFKNDTCIDVTVEMYPTIPAGLNNEGYYLGLPQYGLDISLYKSDPEKTGQKYPALIRFQDGRFVFINR